MRINILHRWLMTLAVGSAVFMGARNATAADAPATPAATPDLPPDMADALKKLQGDPGSSAIAEATDKLQQALAAQFRQTLTVQQIIIQIQKKLAAELRNMTGVIVPANGVQVAGLIEFNEAVSRWTLEVLDLSEDEATPLLKWGLTDEHIGLVARAYNRNPDVRADAVADIAKIDGPEADWMFLQLLQDRDRRVSLTAMDAAYDRKPSAAVLNSLWNAAAGNLISQVRQRQGRQTVVNVHGNPISVYEDNSPARNQDPGVAADVLASYKDPSIAQRIDELFSEMATRAEQQHNSYAWRNMLPGYGGGNDPRFMHLVEVSNPKAAVRFFMGVIENVGTNEAQTTTMNDEKLRFSPRIEAAAMVFHLTGQTPSDFGLTKVDQWGGRWAIKGDTKEEADMIAKLEDWWKKHAKEYGVETPAPADAAPAP